MVRCFMMNATGTGHSSMNSHRCLFPTYRQKTALSSYPLKTSGSPPSSPQRPRAMDLGRRCRDCWRPVRLANYRPQWPSNRSNFYWIQFRLSPPQPAARCQSSWMVVEFDTTSGPSHAFTRSPAIELRMKLEIGGGFGRPFCFNSSTHSTKPPARIEPR